MDIYVEEKPTYYYWAHNFLRFIYKHKAILYGFNKHWIIQESNFHVYSRKNILSLIQELFTISENRHTNVNVISYIWNSLISLYLRWLHLSWLYVHVCLIISLSSV